MRLRLPALIAALGLAGWGAGCATSAPATAPARAANAQLHIANLTPYTWRIAFRAERGPVPTRQVARAAVVDLELEPGDYQIEQTLLDAGVTEPTRRFPLRVEAGQSYRWNLATLLSESASAEGATEGAGRD